MKYYIPTSSLNIENILQAESISPFSFYSKRKSGYTSIEIIDELREYSNQIVLFDYPPHFIIEDKGRINYPMLIEVDDDKQLNDVVSKGNGIYFCLHTIYLTPGNCKFFFFTSHQFDVAIVNAQDDKFIKNYRLYKFERDAKSMPCKEMVVKHFENVDKPFDSKEVEVDKIKGALYALLVGQRKSLSSKLARQKRITQELYNILTSVKNNVSVIGNFSAKIEDLFGEYKRNDSVEQKNREKFDSLLKEKFRFVVLSLYGFRQILKELGIEEYLQSKWGCELLPNVSSLKSPADIFSLREKIDHRTQEEIRRYQNELVVSLDNVSVDCFHLQLDDKQLISRVVNYIVEQKLTPSHLLANRSTVCVNIVNNVIRPFFKMDDEKWTQSVERAYLMKLFNRINNPREIFVVNDIENKEIRDVAIFILSGDKYENVETYMSANEVEDYQSVYLLWGALYGYMELSKDHLSDILTLNNYQCVYEKIFGRDSYTTISRGSEDFVQDATEMYSNKNSDDNVNKSVVELNGVCGQQELPFDSNVQSFDIKKLSCFEGLSRDAIDRIEDNWNYTGYEYKKEGRKSTKTGKMLSFMDHINFFISLCKKDGLGKGRSKKLKNIFTEEFASKVRNELMKYEH